MKNNNLKKSSFSLDLSGLSTYTDELGGLLLAEAVTKAKTMEVGYVQSGIKGTQAINLLSSNLAVQNAGSCGWTQSGTTIFTQRDISVCPYAVKEDICLDQLNNFWAGQLLNAGSYNEEIPASLGEAIAKLKVEQIAKFVDDKLWNALPASSGGTDCFVGFYYLFGDTVPSAEQVNFVTSPTTAFTPSNMLQIVDEVIATIPDALQEDTDLIVMMSLGNYRKYTIGLRQANYFHFGTETAEAGTEFITFHPGTNIRVIGLGSISGNRVVAGKTSELVCGTDLMDEQEKLDIYYSRDFDTTRILAKFKVGAQIPFPQNWVSNNLA
jgi:hypothetical protein